MRTPRKITTFIPGAILLGIAMVFSGCYTILMHPGMETEDLTASAGSGATYTTEINYNADCTSCHSAAELADRSYDASRYDLQSVHGIAVDPYGWKSPKHSRPWWNPTVNEPIQMGSGAISTTSTPPQRPRPSGPTQGKETPTRPGRPSTPEDQNPPTTISPIAPTYTPTAPAAPSAPIGSQIAPTNTPAPQAPSTPTTTGGERRRSSGSTRGD